jgi:hypothetical protein
MHTKEELYMFYIGHFSFNGFEEKPKHGYFTCLVDAKSVEEALDRFRNLFSRLSADSEIFRDVSSVYLDVVTQVKEVPPVAFLAHMVTRGGELDPAISTSLPEPDRRYLEAFAIAPDSQEGEIVEIEPFMTFQ